MGNKRNRSGGSKAKVARPMESRAAEAITVLWMLTTVCALVAQILSGLLTLIALIGQNAPAGNLAGVVFLIAIISGLIAVVCLPVVRHVRLSQPPRAIQWISGLVGFLPVVILVIGALVHVFRG